MQADADRQNAVEMANDRYQTFRSVNLPPAHAANANDGSGYHRVVEGLGAAAIVLGPPALQHRHQALDDTKVSGALTALAVSGNGAADSIQDLVAVTCDLSLAAIVRCCEASEWIAGGKRHVVGYRPWKAAISTGQDIARAIEVETAKAHGIMKVGEAPTLPPPPASAVPPFGQAIADMSIGCCISLARVRIDRC